MVYPILKINQNNTSCVQIIDNEFKENPIAEFTSNSLDENFDNMMVLLRAFINQYDVGYDDGYLQCLEDEEDELE